MTPARQANRAAAHGTAACSARAVSTCHRTWRSGFDVQLTSNDTYLQRYELSYLDRFTSNAFIEQIRDRNRLSFDG